LIEFAQKVVGKPEKLVGWCRNVFPFNLQGVLPYDKRRRKKMLRCPLKEKENKNFCFSRSKVACFAHPKFVADAIIRRSR
jgi:hypothetical protein